MRRLSQPLPFVPQAWPSSLLSHDLGKPIEKELKAPIGVFPNPAASEGDPSSSRADGGSSGGGRGGGRERSALPGDFERYMAARRDAGAARTSDPSLAALRPHHSPQPLHRSQPASTPRTMAMRGLRIKVTR